MTKATILIVDDEPTILASMSKILNPLYRVRAANSGQRALQVAATEPVPDLILLDVLMPDMDGYSVLAQLQENSVSHDIPVIFITAMETASDEERGLQMGAVDYIIKPINATILLARIKIHLSLKKANNILQDSNAYLEKEVTKRLAENQIIQDVSIRALAHIAETRDPETGDHILRTQGFVHILAKRLQKHPRFRDTLSEHYIQLLTKSAPLHDIGKVGIPDNILLKPGKLTADEWIIMKTHAQLGSLAISKAERDVQHPVEFLVLAKEIAHWHHERWDGSGYPDGLAGDEIPISARIMAIVDVFDALISKRIYKLPMSFSEAWEIIEAEHSAQFDPDVTDAFLDGFDEFVEIAHIYPSHLKMRDSELS